MLFRFSNKVLYIILNAQENLVVAKAMLNVFYFNLVLRCQIWVFILFKVYFFFGEGLALQSLKIMGKLFLSSDCIYMVVVQVSIFFFFFFFLVVVVVVVCGFRICDVCFVIICSFSASGKLYFVTMAFPGYLHLYFVSLSFLNSIYAFHITVIYAAEWTLSPQLCGLVHFQ